VASRHSLIERSLVYILRSRLVERSRHRRRLSRRRRYRRPCLSFWLCQLRIHRSVEARSDYSFLVDVKPSRLAAGIGPTSNPPRMNASSTKLRRVFPCHEDPSPATRRQRSHFGALPVHAKMPCRARLLAEDRGLPCVFEAPVDLMVSA